MNKILYAILLSLSILPTCLQASGEWSMAQEISSLKAQMKIRHQQSYAETNTKTNLIKALRLNAINNFPMLYNNQCYEEIEEIVGKEARSSPVFLNSDSDIIKYLDFSPQGTMKNYKTAFLPYEKMRSK